MFILSFYLFYKPLSSSYTMQTLKPLIYYRPRYKKKIQSSTNQQSVLCQTDMHIFEKLSLTYINSFLHKKNWRWCYLNTALYLFIIEKVEDGYVFCKKKCNLIFVGCSMLNISMWMGRWRVQRDQVQWTEGERVIWIFFLMKKWFYESETMEMTDKVMVKHLNACIIFFNMKSLCIGSVGT